MTLPYSSSILSPADFRNVLSKAAWDWSLEQFCAALQWEVDDYSRQKFKEFQVAGRALSLFSGDTLRQIIDAVIAERDLALRQERANLDASLRLRMP